jgi:hypothetical protein
VVENYCGAISDLYVLIKANICSSGSTRLSVFLSSVGLSY